jgi:hypothetical protein
MPEEVWIALTVGGMLAPGLRRSLGLKARRVSEHTPRVHPKGH